MAPVNPEILPSLTLCRAEIASPLAIMVLGGGCSLFGSETEGLSRGVYEGFYRPGFESNGFGVCSKEENWFVTGERAAQSELVKRWLDAVPEDTRGEAFVRLRGKPSRKGDYGPSGNSDRTFDLVEVLKVQADSAETCN